MVFLIKDDFEKKQQTTKKVAKLPSVKRVEKGWDEYLGLGSHRPVTLTQIYKVKPGLKDENKLEKIVSWRIGCLYNHFFFQDIQ